MATPTTTGEIEASLAETHEMIQNATAAGDQQAVAFLKDHAAKLLDQHDAMVYKKENQGAMGALKAAGSGAFEGVTGALTFPGQLMRDVAERRMPFSRPPEEGDLLDPKTYSKNLGIDYEPQNRAQRYIKSATGGAAGGMVSPGRAVPNALMGLLSGAGAEAGGEVGGPGGSVVGAMVPFAAKGAANARLSNSERLVQNVLGRNVDLSEERARADEIKRRYGIDLTVGQASDDPAVRGLEGALERSPHGSAIQETKAGQWEPGRQVAENFKASFGGSPDLSQELANAIQRHVVNAAAGPYRARSAEAQAGERGAAREAVDPTGNVDIQLSLQDLARSYGGEASPAYRAVQRVADRIRDSQKRGPAQTVIVKDAQGNDVRKKVPGEFLPTPADELLKLGNEYAGMKDPVSQAIGRKIIESLQDKSTSVSDSTRRIADIQTQEIDPMERSAFGKVFPPSKRGPTGDWGNLTKIFDFTQFGQKDVADVGNRIRAQDPQAWLDMTRRSMEGKWDSSALFREGRPRTQGLGEWASSVRPDSAEGRAAFNEAMNQTALAQQGIDPAKFVAGANHVMDTLQTISRGQGNVGKMTTGDIYSMAGENMLSRGLKSFSLQPLYQWGEAIEQHTARKNMEMLSKAFSTPEGARIIESLSNASVGSRESLVAIQALLAGGGVAGARSSPSDDMTTKAVNTLP